MSQSEKESSCSSEEEGTPTPRLQWIYDLKKTELKQRAKNFSLPTQGGVRELRKRLRQYFLDNPHLWNVRSDLAMTGNASEEKSDPGVVPQHQTSTMPLMPGYPTNFPLFPFMSPFANLKYNGTSNAEEFLTKLDERRQMFCIPDNTLFLWLPQILGDTPLLWYRLHKSEWNVWSAFEKAFQKSFFPLDYQDRLRKEIERRTQGDQENITNFVVSLRTLMSRLIRPLSSQEQLERIYKNLLPKYQFYIRFCELTSMEDLIQRGQQFEQLEHRAKNFKPPPTPDKSLCPDTAYKAPTNRKFTKPMVNSEKHPTLCAVQSADQKKKVSDKKIIEKKVLPPNLSSPKHSLPVPVICWNCHATDHKYPDCKKPKEKLFCFHCGKPGETYRTCPKCGKQGNDWRVREMGLPRAQQPI